MKFVKCLAVGDRFIGKTSLIMQYATKMFPYDSARTRLLECYSTYELFDGNEPVNLVLWDTVEQGDARTLPVSCPRADVILICFSIVDKASFKNVQTKWLPQVRSNCPDVPIILVGTKMDLNHDFRTLRNLRKLKQRPIRLSQGVAMAKKIGAIKYVECSAVTRAGLKDLFDAVMRTVLCQPQMQTKGSECAIL